MALCCLLGISGPAGTRVSGANHAALRASDTALRIRRSDGCRPEPSSSQDSGTPVNSETLRSVERSGSSFRPDSRDAIVARERPAPRPKAAAESSVTSRSHFTRSMGEVTATSIAKATNVVKSGPLAAIRIAVQDPPVRTLAQRIIWIQENSGSKKLSLAEVARRGKMSRQGLSRIVRESVKAPGKPIGLSETMTELARGNNVDLDWLQTGRGAPRRGKLTARDIVLAERDWPEPARAAALADNADRSAESWRQLLRAVEAAIAGQTAPASRRGTGVS